METTDIYVAKSSEIVKQRSPKAIFYSLAMIAVGGAVTLYATTFMEDKTSALYMLLTTAGIIAVAVGLLKIFFSSKQYVFVPTKSPIYKHSVFFNSGEIYNLINALESNNIDNIKKLRKEDSVGVRLDLVHSKDKKFTACQVFEYVPYTYEPASKIFEIPEEHRDNLVSIVMAAK